MGELTPHRRGRRVVRTAEEMEALTANVLDMARRRPDLSAERIGRLLSASHVTVRGILRRHGVETAPRPDGSPPKGLIAAAKAELHAGQPLRVETLRERLGRLVPGAQVEQQDAGWAVSRNTQTLATGATEREAIDRAVFLWGRR